MLAVPSTSSPLLDELHSLRSSLHRAQSTSHQTSLQLHSASLANTLTLDKLHALESTNAALVEELTVLRDTPAKGSEAVALEEKLKLLSLAHRKLSALADEADASVARVLGEKANEQAWRSRAELKLARLLPPLPPPDEDYQVEANDISDDSSMSAPRSKEVKAQPSAHDLELQAFRLELEVEREAARKDQARLAELEVELDRKRREDNAAALVVERYMAFSQSASLVLHAQLHALRTRHAASLATLTKENEQLRRELNKERREADRTRIRLGQVGEEAWIEAEGRRREIGLRLAAISREQRLMDNLRKWYDRVQKVLSKFADSDASGEVDSTSSTSVYALLMPVLGEASQILSVDAGPTVGPNEEEQPSAESSRVYMAEELLSAAMEDLRLEQTRRRALEGRAAVQQDDVPVETAVVEKETVEVVKPSAETDKPIDQTTTSDPSTAPLAKVKDLPPPSPKQEAEEDSSDPLLASLLSSPSRHTSLQTRYADLHSGLTSLLASPSPAVSSLPDDLSALLSRALTRLSDILEDARVELEIAVDDERRVVESYRVLLKLGQEGKGTKASELIRMEVKEFVQRREGGEGADAVASDPVAALSKRAEDIEWDFAALKAAWINPDSLLSSPLGPMSPSTSPLVSPLSVPRSTQHLFPAPLSSSYFHPGSPSGTASPSRNVLTNLGLRTLQPASLLPPVHRPSSSQQDGGYRRSSFANLGRMFRDQPPTGPARSFSFQSASSSASGVATTEGGHSGGGWASFYRQPSATGSSLGLLHGGLTSPGGESVNGGRLPEGKEEETVALDDVASEDEVE